MCPSKKSLYASHFLWKKCKREDLRFDSIFGCEGLSFFIRLLSMNNITLKLRWDAFLLCHSDGFHSFILYDYFFFCSLHMNDLIALFCIVRCWIQWKLKLCTLDFSSTKKIIKLKCNTVILHLFKSTTLFQTISMNFCFWSTNKQINKKKQEKKKKT